MNLFEKVKDNVTVVDAATRYGLTVSRNSMTRCPFHDDHTPSLKLNQDYFYCFGCGAKGDVIDLTARLCDLSLTEAVGKLVRDFGIDDTGQTTKTTKTSTEAQQFRDKERLCFSVLVDYLKLLREWKTRYVPKTPEDTFDDRFVEACHKEAYIEYLTDIFVSGSREERQQTEDELLTDGSLFRLKDHTKIHRRKGGHHERV